MVRLSELITKIEVDIENRLSEARDIPVSVKHVETSISDNQTTVTLQADPQELIPELNDEDYYKDISLREFKIEISPQSEFVDFQNADLPEC